MKKMFMFIFASFFSIFIVVSASAENLENFISQITDQTNGYYFASSSEIKSDTITVVSIVRKGEYARGYKLLQESDNVKIKDSGNIYSAFVKNSGDVPLFVKMGSILEGDTQERVVTRNYIILPDEEKQVELRCVHKSKSIHSDTSMKSKSFAPEAVIKTCYNYENQVGTWDSVKSYSVISNDSGVFLSKGKDDDLVTHVEQVTQNMSKVFPYLPNEEDQVGVAFFDKNGLVSLELFSDKESWKAVKEKIICSKIKTVPSLKNVNYSKKIKENLLLGLKKKISIKVMKNNDNLYNETYSDFVIENENYIGSYVEFLNKIIYFNIIRK